MWTERILAFIQIQHYGGNFLQEYDNNCCLRGDSAWFMWTTVFIGIAVMFIADFMFLNENEFVYKN